MKGKLMVFPLLLILSVGLVSAICNDAGICTDSQSYNDLSNDVSTTHESKKSKSSGGGCLTAWGIEDRTWIKRNVLTLPYLSSINARDFNLPKYYKKSLIINNKIAPKGFVWKIRIIDGEYCYAWDKEKHRGLIKPRPLADDVNATQEQIAFPLMSGWWRS